MPVWQIFKVSRKTFFNPSAWLDVENISANTRNIWNTIRDLFRPAAAPARVESFAEAVQRFGLNEEELKRIKNNYLIYAVIFGLIGIIVLVFTFYLVIRHKTGHGFILGIAASALFLGQTFRYHFWYFQIKVRKLGCTFEEWRRGKVINRDIHP